ncbi:MAG TPA: hypothetical protein VMU83_20445 [Hanamia sp.]|nr:hypothetical protein [Hanamia sp.]
MSLTNNTNGFASFFLFHGLALSINISQLKDRSFFFSNYLAGMLNIIPEIDFGFVIPLVGPDEAFLAEELMSCPKRETPGGRMLSTTL